MLGISTGNETVVLLDKEPESRGLVSQMLELAGYTVREAASGAETVRLIEDRSHPADLLLADIAASSVELTRLLARQYPNLRILVTTGPSDEEAAMDVAGAGAHVLSKPFSPGALMAKVRQVLDGPLASRGAAAGR